LPGLCGRVVGGAACEDHFPAGGGDDGLNLDRDGGPDGVAGIGDDDHGPVGEVTDGLAGILTGFGEVDLEGIADDGLGIEGFGEAVEVEPLDIVELGDLGEVVVGREELGLHGLGEVDELGIDAPAVFDGAVVDAEIDFLHGPEAVEDLKALAAAGLAAGIAGIGDGLELVDDETGNDEAVAHEAGLADPGEAAVDKGAGVDEGEGDIDIVGNKADVGDDEVEFIAAAEGDDGPEVHEDDVEDETDKVEVLGEDEGGFIPVFEGDVKEGRGADEEGAEPADEETEGEGGEPAEGKALEEDVDEDDKRAEGAPDEDPEPAVLVPFRDGVADEPSTEEGKEEEK